MAKKRILIADDHILVREGTKNLIETEDDLECVGLAGNGKEAIELAMQLLPDIAIIDIAMPKIDGIEAASEIKKSCPNTKIIIVSAYDYARYFVACIKAGVDGYLLKKDLPANGLINAIRLVIIGAKVFASEASEAVLKKLSKMPDKEVATFGRLGSRELEILRLSTRGLSSKDIATRLAISPPTVSTHFTNIYRKLGVESRFEAMLYALREGWITVAELDSDNSLDVSDLDF